jgi:hypothetical protein
MSRAAWLSPAGVQQAVGENMAPVAVAAQLISSIATKARSVKRAFAPCFDPPLTGIASTVHSNHRAPGGSIRSSPVISATCSAPLIAQTFS